MLPWFRRFAISLVLLCCCAAGAPAVTLDWDAITWTPGSLSNSYDIDPGSPGDDITITVTGDTATLVPSIFTGNPQTPAVTTQFAGGMSPTPGTLNLALNLSNSVQAVTVTLTFSNDYTNGIFDLSFNIFDVDYANVSGNTYQDQLRNIYGTTPGGTQIAPTITTSASNQLIGSGLSQVVNGTASVPDTGASSGNGNVTINFGTIGLRSFTFTYGSTNAFANPTYQHVGFFDFSYSPIPEVNPAIATGISCLAAILLIVFHRGRIKARRQLR